MRLQALQSREEGEESRTALKRFDVFSTVQVHLGSGATSICSKNKACLVLLQFKRKYRKLMCLSYNKMQKKTLVHKFENPTVPMAVHPTILT